MYTQRHVDEGESLRNKLRMITMETDARIVSFSCEQSLKYKHWTAGCENLVNWLTGFYVDNNIRFELNGFHICEEVLYVCHKTDDRSGVN